MYPLPSSTAAKTQADPTPNEGPSGGVSEIIDTLSHPPAPSILLQDQDSIVGFQCLQVAQ